MNRKDIMTLVQMMWLYADFDAERLLHEFALSGLALDADLMSSSLNTTQAVVVAVLEHEFAKEKPVLHIISVERGESSGSKSPKWTCELREGGKLWVFQHNDPERNNYPLFAAAGYGDVLDAMAVGETLFFNTTPIRVLAKKDDKNYWRVTDVLPATPNFAPDTTNTAADDRRRKCAQIAANWLKLPGGLLIVDTETTGVFDDDEIVSIAIIDALTGAVLLDTLVKPTKSIPARATEIHGITDEMVQNAPSVLELPLYSLLHDKNIVAYGADFDERLIYQSYYAEEGRSLAPIADWHCLKTLYAEYRGDWNSHFQSWKWHTLSAACEQMNVPFVGAQHSAVGDAQAALALLKAMAAEALSEIPF